MSDLNGLVHERDRLLGEVERLNREIARRDSERRHWIALICDRCGCKLEVSCTLLIPDDRMQQMLGHTGLMAGWQIGRETAAFLGPTGPESAARADLCHECRRATAPNLTAAVR